MTPDEILSRVLYKDQDVIVLDKPAGLAVHAGPNSPDHLELYLPGLSFGWAEVPKLAHRLDRDTSGCLILGRHAKAIKRLGKMFEQHRVDKVYWSVCHGAPEADSGTVDAPLLKVSARGQGWRIKVDPAGQPSMTDWSVLGRGGGLSWIEWRPRTGRTHQIRIHAKHLGCPLLGDAYYGPDPETKVRLHLLARAVSFPALAPSKEPVRVTAPPPAHMIEALRTCGWRGD
ncbi:putative pseudouridine synthase in lpd 3'region [Paramagnetospirillum caucaseum]|uniref:Putative pseudouridine synthase in lpd 3'region n=1 Tax=Paramagnetospirillum caucaseum TaxID=1244869 RepID=M2ZMA7_9PROT|nr:RluA family pseudouridine synthase [Paramagnetospirillum caucaseum]EME68427.1 putative pseudouridine synthase in lpd 3'region [Paramagnetospirillum caucaseum]